MNIHKLNQPHNRILLALAFAGYQVQRRVIRGRRVMMIVPAAQR